MLKTCRILVVVFDNTLRRKVVKSLNLQGYEVVEAASNMELDEVLKSGSFDCILCGQDEGGKKLGLCRRLREGLSPCDTAIVMLCKRPDHELVTEFLQAGVDSWIELPHAHAIFSAGVADALRNRTLIQKEEVVGDWVEFRLQSTLDILQSINAFIANLLVNTTMDEDEVRKLGFAINEMLINAMEHGNSFDVKKEVKCSYVLFSDKVIIKVEDQGSGFSLADVPDPIQDPMGVASLRQKEGKRPGGYGLAMTRKYVDITYSAQGNVVLLTKNLEPVKEDGED